MGPETPDIIKAHAHSIRHREDLLASALCGCFYCGQTFPPSEITGWIDDVDGRGQTAVCPRCGIDSVVGSASGCPVTPEFLERMHARWFRA